ncbi:MAG: hypothetical protein IPL59_12490 [Candidatus Competibacteraceae bacterium]|nr:hypothetical protein [Candidatus Competibacteraceae bacterium]
MIAIADQVQQDYVVQLDADTVTLDDLVEVKMAIASGTAFTLGTEDNQNFTWCKDVSFWAQQRLTAGQHIQVFCEAGLDKIPGYETRKYVRGCAGFAGFPKHSFSRDVLRDFGQTIGPLLGDQWNAWGTEQFTSNYIVSNAQQAMVLPHPKYCHPGRERVGTVFLHFIGYVRYATGRYANLAKMTNNMLRIEATQKGIYLN